jgi:hypothetical protein
MKIQKFLMLSVFLLITISSYAKKDLEQYYQLSQKATAEVCKGNYDKANRMFKDAFKDYKITYFTDLNNALYAAVRSNKIDSIYIKKLFAEIGTRGISIRERFGKRPAYTPYINLMASSNSDSLPAKDPIAVNHISDAILRDQAIRSISGKLSQPNFYTRDKFILPAVRAIDSANFEVVCDVLRSALKKKENLERTVGYQAVQSLITMLWHCSPWGYDNKELLDSCLAVGVLYAPLVANAFDHFCTGGYYLNVQSRWLIEQNCHKVYGLYGSSASLQFTETCYIFKMADSTLKVINHRRKQHYLNDVYENAKIISYAFFFASEGFVYPGVESIPDRDFENSYEQILKNKGIKHILYRSKEDYDYNRKW